jgi:hypothetical protein
MTKRTLMILAAGMGSRDGREMMIDHPERLWS